MKQFCRTTWEPVPSPNEEGKVFACSLYHCPQCGTVMKPTPLTPREIEVFRAYGEGLSTSKIADMLFVEAKTIESHRRSIMIKMGASTMIRAVVMGIKQGVIVL